MYDTTLSQKYIKDMGLCKKKIKDAYPKKVCYMLRHVKKKIKEKIAPYPRENKRRDGSYKGVHTPSTKKISAHLHILMKVYDLFLLWIKSLT